MDGLRVIVTVRFVFLIFHSQKLDYLLMANRFDL